MDERPTDPAVRRSAALGGLRILVVEDEFVLALAFEQALEAAGCEVVGPVGHLRQAEAAARESRLDGAILDFKLHGERASTVAEALLRAGVPVVFATASSEGELPLTLRDVPRLQKPFSLQHLLDIASETFGRPRLRLA